MSMKKVEDFYPLSPMQQGMLFHSLYAPESGVYVEQMSCTLRGDLDTAAFERAWQRVVDRHAILRTAFAGEGLKEPVQVVHRQVKLPVEQQDWQELSPAEQEARLETLLQEERRQGFKLSEPPLMRMLLTRIAEDTYNFAWTHHHILLDGWSIPPLLQEVFAFYDAFRQGQDLHLELPPPYRDYIVWLKRQDLAKAEAFWRQTLQGFTAPTPLVMGRAWESAADEGERADQDGRYDEQEMWLSPDTTTALQSLARQYHLTLSTLVQGAWALLLSRYSGEDDVLFGATVSGRPADLRASELMIGLFINTLPVRVRVPPRALVADWLKDLQAQLVDMRQYEYSPLVEIQGWSDVPHGSALFESILVFENYPVDATSLQGQEGSLKIENLRSVEQTNYPLTVVAGAAEALMLKIVYDVRRFEADTIRRMLGHLATLLEGFAADPERPISTLPLLAEAERQQLLVEWNDNAADYPLGQCVHELFEDQVEQTPNAIAVTYEGEDLTYGELNLRANHLAHRLQELGVGPEGLVGICAERSMEMIIAILGILKAGGAFLPLDPAYPQERLAFMLEDAQVSVLLTQEQLLKRLPAHDAEVIGLDADWKEIPEESADNPVSGVTPDNLAYVIYTSGSTGRPKGTLLQHRGLCNLAHLLIPIFCIEADSRVLQFASFSFDASVAEVFPVLVTGATLCMARQDTLASGPDLIQLLRDRAITIATLPPSMLAILPAVDVPALATIVSAGERCSGDIVARWAPSRRFINGYGPTETTVAASYWTVDDPPEEVANVPIGRPIPNTQIYLLDDHLRPVPVGVPGELHVGGVSLARGYLNRAEKTAERFIPDPFSDEPGARLYKTGDLACHLPDGNAGFLGRIDHQVKIRGFRIELGEVETLLSQHPAVQQAIALAREDIPGDKRLVAYIVPGQERAPTASELHDLLKENVPEYMIPSAFVTLDALPLTPNGKVDRKALPVPERTRPEMEREFIAPRDALELRLVQIWEDVLNVQPIGVKDNFFELGGHSLLAVRLIAQIEKQLDAKVSMVDLFRDPTVAQLASILRRQEGAAPTPTLVPIQPKGSKRPLFFVHPSGGSVHWYADLARCLGVDQPFYGIQAQGGNGDDELHTRIEDMAAHYVKAVRDFQPEGPYLLGSWSMGVAVAFEMAQQFYTQEQEVALLALLDQGPILPAEEPEDDAAYLMDVFGKRLPLSLEHLRDLAPDEQVAYVWKEARRAEWIYPEVTLPQFRHFVRMLRTHTEAWRRYEPQVYPGQVTVFRTSEQSGDGALEPDLGWGELAAGGVEIHEVPGDHLSMIHEPHVQALTECLRACLDAVQAANSGGEQNRNFTRNHSRALVGTAAREPVRR
jgi:amino acid adenylation domain-containing protein